MHQSEHSRGSQNGEIHSGVCIESNEDEHHRHLGFFQCQANLRMAVNAVREMARYGRSKRNLFGIQVISEPHLHTDEGHAYLQSYYQQAILAAREFLDSSASETKDFAAWLVEQMDFACGGSMLWSYDNRITAWSLQRQWQELGLNWRSLWAESDGAFLEGPMVGFRAAAFGTRFRPNDRLLLSAAYSIHDTEVTTTWLIHTAETFDFQGACEKEAKVEVKVKSSKAKEVEAKEERLKEKKKDKKKRKKDHAGTAFGAILINLSDQPTRYPMMPGMMMMPGGLIGAPLISGVGPLGMHGAPTMPYPLPGRVSRWFVLHQKLQKRKRKRSGGGLLRHQLHLLQLRSHQPQKWKWQRQQRQPLKTWYEFYWLCCKDTASYCWTLLQLQARQAWLQLNGEATEVVSVESEAPPLRELLRDRAKALLLEGRLVGEQGFDGDEPLKEAHFQLQSLRAVLESKDKELVKIKDRNMTLQKEKDQVLAESQESRAELQVSSRSKEAAAQEQIDHLQQDLSARGTLLEELDAAKVKLSTELEELKTTLAQNLMDLQRSKEVECQRSRELLKVQEQMETDREEVKSLRSTLDRAHDELERSKAKESKHQREVLNLQKSMEEQKNETAKLKEIEALQHQLREKAKDMDTLNYELKQREAQLEELQQQMSKLQQLDAQKLQQLEELQRLGEDSVRKVVEIESAKPRNLILVWTGMGSVDEVQVTGKGESASFVVKSVGSHKKIDDELALVDHMSYYNEATFYEQDLSERICAAGALCPKPLLVDRTEDGDLTICMTKLPGRGFSRSPEQTHLALQWLARLHALYWGKADEAIELRRMPQDVLRWAAKGIDERLQADKMQTMCHGDPKGANIMAEAADRVDKGSWRLESDRNAMLENTLKKPTELLNVQADLQKAKQVEQELEQMWMEQLESEATAKQTAAKKVTVKSAGVEAMGFQAAIDRTTQSMFDLLARQQALILQAQEDGSLLETELLRKECEEKQEECQALVPEVVSSIEELKKEWIDKKTKAELTKNAEQLHTDAGQVAKEFKTWNAQDEAWVKLKGKVKDWKAWLCKTQAQTKKAEKAGAQARAAANNKVGNATSWFDLPLCKQAVQDLKDSNFDGFEDKGNGWNLGRDMLDCEDAAEVTPVVFTATQGLPYASDMKGFDYFKFQKVWVAEQMKKSGGATWLSALCTKSTVSKKLAGYWSKLLGPECEKFVREFPEVLRELFQPQFYQQDENSCAVHLLPDFGMADVRISLEGSCYLMGFPLQKMGGKDLASKRETLQRQSWATFKHMCTWAVHLQEGKVVAIPGDHVFCSVTCEEHHGGRIHALCQGHAKRTMDMTKLLMRDNGLLAGLKTGKLHDTLQSLVSAAAAGASASSGQEDQKMGEEDGDEEVAEPQPKRARAESAKAPKKTAKPKAGKQ
eukprot:g24588.t1